jgi:CoA:oxalate CoA-transferase
VAPIWNIGQALASPQAQARQLLHPVDDERLPGLRLPVQPVRFGDAAPMAPTRAPRLGEHSDELLTTLLGLSAQRLDELKAAGVLGINAQPPRTPPKNTDKE